VVSALARKDPARAEEILAALPSSRDRDTALVQFLRETKTTDPARYAEAAASVPLDPSSYGAAGIYHDWSVLDPGAALANLRERLKQEGLPENEEAAVSGLLTGIFDRRITGPGSLSKVADAVLQGASEPMSPFDEAAMRGMGRWAFRGRDEFTKWLETVPEGGPRAVIVESAVDTLGDWAKPDLTKFVSALPEGASREAGATKAVRHLLMTDLPAARAMLELLPPAGQKEALQKTWDYWVQRDPTWANNWRKTNTELTEAERSGLGGR
jgi:hypothetical protein